MSPYDIIKENYREKEDRALKLIKENKKEELMHFVWSYATNTLNLFKPLLYDWEFKWENNSVWGQCDHKKKYISLSERNLMGKESKPINTVLHEIAHALTHPDVNHGQPWKDQMILLGLPPERLGGSTEDIRKTTAKWMYFCVTCGYKDYRYRRFNRGINYSCGKCDPVFNEKYLLKLKPNPYRTG